MTLTAQKGLATSTPNASAAPIVTTLARLLPVVAPVAPADCFLVSNIFLTSFQDTKRTDMGRKQNSVGTT